MFVDRITHGSCHRDGLLGVVAARQWVIEDNDDTVAHEAFERSAEAVDLLTKAGVVLAKNGCTPDALYKGALSKPFWLPGSLS
jgi:hypothetical protein